MRYNIRVTNRETKTVWHHDGLTKEEISWIQCNANLIVEIRSEAPDTAHHQRDSRYQQRDDQE
jgi:hypothetical protein